MVVGAAVTAATSLGPKRRFTIPLFGALWHDGPVLVWCEALVVMALHRRPLVIKNHLVL